MEILKIVLIIVALSLMGLLIKRYNQEFGIVFSITVATVFLGILIGEFFPLLQDIINLAEKAGIKENYITTLIKALGICYITDFAVEACKESGEQSLASKASLCGRIAIIVLAMPLIKDVLEISLNILEN